MSKDCAFCLKNNLLKSPILSETDQAYLVEAYGHSQCNLIVPKEHYEELTSLPDDWWRHCKQLLANIHSNTDSYNLSVNIGGDAGQTIKHLHFWIVPRHSGEPATGKGLVTLIDQSNNPSST